MQISIKKKNVGDTDSQTVLIKRKLLPYITLSIIEIRIVVVKYLTFLDQVSMSRTIKAWSDLNKKNGDDPNLYTSMILFWTKETGCPRCNAGLELFKDSVDRNFQWCHRQCFKGKNDIELINPLTKQVYNFSMLLYYNYTKEWIYPDNPIMCTISENLQKRDKPLIFKNVYFDGSSNSYIN